MRLRATLPAWHVSCLCSVPCGCGPAGGGRPAKAEHAADAGPGAAQRRRLTGCGRRSGTRVTAPTVSGSCGPCCAAPSGRLCARELPPLAARRKPPTGSAARGWPAGSVQAGPAPLIGPAWVPSHGVELQPEPRPGRVGAVPSAYRLIFRCLQAPSSDLRMSRNGWIFIPRVVAPDGSDGIASTSVSGFRCPNAAPYRRSICQLNPGRSWIVPWRYAA